MVPCHEINEFNEKRGGIGRLTSYFVYFVYFVREGFFEMVHLDRAEALSCHIDTLFPMMTYGSKIFKLIKGKPGERDSAPPGQYDLYGDFFSFSFEGETAAGPLFMGPVQNIL